MNSFALASDSHSWWLPSAIIGAIGATALGAVLFLSNTGQPSPLTDTPDAPAVSVPDTGAGRTCVAHRPPRNHGDQLPQPACR
jgi:hypothetical protein